MSRSRNLILCIALVLTAFSLTFAATPSMTTLPTGAQTSISAVLGRDDARYHLVQRNSRWETGNFNRDLKAHFDNKGITIRVGSDAWELTLKSYGHRDAANSPEGADVVVHSNRLEYRRGGLTEWYLNGPGGIEQGFTLQHRPGGHGATMTIAMTTTGSLRAEVDASKTGMRLIGKDGHTVLRYSGIEAYDANQKHLHAWMEVRGQELDLRVDDSQAQYPVVVDPIMQLGKLTAAGGSFSDGFGISASIAGDTIVIGANSVDGTEGAAYVFVKPASGWATMTETAKLTASQRFSEDFFGRAVGISGNTIVAGKAPCSGGNSAPGKVYVFVKPAGGWTSGTETAQLSASDGQICDTLGWYVGMSGNAIVAGENKDSAGAAYVFVKPTNGWVSGTQTAKLTSSVNDNLEDVAINQNTIVVSANSNNAKQQAASVFVKPAAGWTDMTQTARLTSSDWQLGDAFNFPAIFGDTIVVGDPSNNSQQGAAYVFVRPASGWTDSTETAKLTASDGVARDGFGIPATNGRVVIVGAGGAKIGNNDFQGAVYVYAKPASGWVTTSTFTHKFSSSNGMAGHFFGSVVAMNSNTFVACDFTLACYVFGN